MRFLTQKLFQEAQKKANHYHKLAAKFNAELNEAKLKGQAQGAALAWFNDIIAFACLHALLFLNLV